MATISITFKNERTNFSFCAAEKNLMVYSKVNQIIQPVSIANHGMA